MSNVMPKQEEFLYKYRAIDTEHPERTKRMFTKNEIYFPPPSAFNDPFDCKIGYSFGNGIPDAEKYLDRILKERSPNLNRNQRRAQSRAQAKFINNPSVQSEIKSGWDKISAELGVYSLSKLPDDILMWSHYSDSHCGFCMKFLHDEHEPFFGRAQPVIYSDTYPVVRVFDEDKGAKLFEAVTTKAKHWEYEEEWRIPDFKEGPGLKKFPPDLLVGVIFGCRMSEMHKELIRGWCFDRQPIPKFYQAREVSERYAIEIEELQTLPVGVSSAPK